MALTINFSPHITTHKSRLVIKPFGKVLRLKQKHISVKKAVLPSLKIRSSFKNKVFEDQSNGIVCYTDESGEIVCEGIDEGPRYHQPVTRKSSIPRDAEIFDLLQQRWNDLVRVTELKPADHKGINCNGFNSMRKACINLNLPGDQ